MEFNAKICKVMEFGMSSKRQIGKYWMGTESLSKTKEKNNLGVTFSKNLSPEIQINGIKDEAYESLRKIRMAFRHLDKKIIRELIVSKLKYAAVVGSPHKTRLERLKE